MPAPLPDRPHLDQLRRQAKELRDGFARNEPEALARVAAQVHTPRRGALSLAVAQLTIAREHGFDSWPALKAAVDAARQAQDRLAAFLEASLTDLSLARSLLEAGPSLAGHPLAAVVTGDAARVEAVLKADPSWVTSVDDTRGWSPLLYACYSRWHTDSAERAEGILSTVGMLLDAGAPPDSHNGRLPNRGYRSALHGSVMVDHPALCRLLLERGARPDDRVSLKLAARSGARGCLRELLAHGATVSGTWALEAAAAGGDAGSVELLLDAMRQSVGEAEAARLATEQLCDIAGGGPKGIVECLLSWGADPDGYGQDPPPLRRAVRAGRDDLAAALVAAGATRSMSSVDSLLGACARGDVAVVEALLAADPDLVGGFSDDDRAALVDLAAKSGTVPVRLLLDLGVPVSVRNHQGETALHTAAYEGRAETVKLLIDRGAELDACDANFEATPLAFATVGSGERPNHDGDWAATVRVLLEAGAAKTDVWLTGDKAPSDEVAEILRLHGVVPAVPPSDLGEKTAERDSPGADLEGGSVLEELAEHLRVAYEQADLELFASLLHPLARMGDGPLACTSREEIVARYQDMTERGMRGEVVHTEATAGALILSIRYRGRATAGRDPEPEMTHQRLEVTDGHVTAIRGYPTLAAARRADGSATVR